MTREGSDGDTTLTVENTEGFSNEDYLVIGEMGEEGTEMVQINAAVTSDHSLTITALVHDHPAYTPVYFIHSNQYAVEYKAPGGAFVHIATPDIEVDEKESEYSHSGGVSAGLYRTRFYNSTTAVFGGYSDEVLGSGYGRRSLRFMVEKVLLLAKDPDAQIATREEIKDFINNAQDEVRDILGNKAWFLWKEGTAVNGVAGQSRYALPSDWELLDTIKCQFNDGVENAKYRLKYKHALEWDYETADLTAEDNDDTRFFTVWPPDDTYAYGSFSVHPAPEHAYHTFYPCYWKIMDDLDSDADITDIPRPRILQNYALAQVAKIRGEEDRSKGYMNNFMVGVSYLKKTQRKVYSPMSLKTYRGRNWMSRMMGNRRPHSDSDRERYW